MASDARVVMLWPADLKAEIQAEVGKRGLTAYVLDAVRAKRAAHRTAEPTPPTAPEVDQRLLVGVAPPDANTGQLVAQCPACGTDLDEHGRCWLCG